jgi:hypothetical protein
MEVGIFLFLFCFKKDLHISQIGAKIAWYFVETLLLCLFAPFGMQTGCDSTTKWQHKSGTNW